MRLANVDRWFCARAARVSLPPALRPVATPARPMAGSGIGGAIRSLAVAGALLSGSLDARAQKVEDGSDGRIGPADTRTVLGLIERHLASPDARVTELRRSGPTLICGSVNVKNRDGLYTGERGFVVDVADASFGRVPDGVEMLAGPRTKGFEALERIRQLYFSKCMD